MTNEPAPAPEALVQEAPMMMAMAAAPVELPITVSNLVWHNNTDVLAQQYQMYAVSFDWSYAGPIYAGDYFKIILPSTVYLHPNSNEPTNENYLPPLYYNGELIANPTIVGNEITYTFTQAAENKANFSGSIQFNNSLTTFKNGGTKLPIDYVIGGSTYTTYVTYGNFPYVPESIYHINSWYNTTIKEYSIAWNPDITGTFIRGFLEIQNGQQY